MHTPRQVAGGPGWPAAVACLLVIALLPSEARAFPTPAGSHAEPGPPSGVGVQVGRPCSEAVEVMLRTAAAFADEESSARAEAILANTLDRCPDHPELLGELAGLRFRQGRLAEAEALATRLVRIHPGSEYGWDLLAATRYLRDDAHGALRAWGHGRPRVVRGMEVDIHGNDGPRASVAGPDPLHVTGIHQGRPLTVEALVRGERRLGALPAAARARLGYRALSDGDAAIHGAVVLRASNPFTGPAMVAHAFRLLGGRRIHIVSADPLGRLERWDLSGTTEGTLRGAEFALAHPAPGGVGVWRWEVDHEVGRYGSAGLDATVREARTGLGWSHTDWLTASLRGTVQSRIDIRPGRGAFAGAGVGWTLFPLTTRSSIGAEGTGWVRMRGGAEGDGEPDQATRFGRVELRGAFHTALQRGGGDRAGSDGTRPGLDVHAGIVAVSSGIPPDLVPRMGASGNAPLLMRARSDLDGEGVVRPLFPGTAWAHGGIELLHTVGTLGPVDVGVAAFADGVRVLAPDRRSADPASRRGAVHLGAGLRARIPWVDGWLRMDWGIDPVDGASTISAAWFREHRLNSLLVR